LVAVDTVGGGNHCRGTAQEMTWNLNMKRKVERESLEVALQTNGRARMKWKGKEGHGTSRIGNFLIEKSTSACVLG